MARPFPDLHRALLALSLTLLAAAAAACGNDSASADGRRGGREGRGGGPGADSGKPSGPPRQVRLVLPETARLARTVAVSGTLAADEQADVAAKVPGRVSQMYVDIGTSVRRGQPLARLLPTDYELRVEQAENALEQARARVGLDPGQSESGIDPTKSSVAREAAAELERTRLTRDRMKRLLDEQLIPRADFDEAEAAWRVADARYQEAVDEARNRRALLDQRRSELEIARKQLSDSVVAAPFDGVIQERQVGVGDYVAVGQVVAVLVKVDPLRLRLAIPERESGGVRPGQEVHLTVEGDPTVHVGRVARISPAISEDNRTLTVEAEVPNSGGRLRPGAFARAEVVVQPGENAPSSVLVPAAAVVTFAGIDKLITVEDGKAVEKRVKLGRRSGGKNGDLVEVVEGIEPGTAVVAQPGNLVNGEPVQVVP